METRNRYVLGIIFINLLIITKTISHSCVKIPENKNRANGNRYIIEISGNPSGYTPGENYTITLKVNPGVSEIRFSEFTLAAEPQNPLQGSLAGKFTLINNVLTAFNADCPQTVIQASYVAKTSVDVLWRAPPSDSGCVVLTAIVIDTSNNWFTDGELKKTLCEEDGDSEDRLPTVLEECSACDEAKYEVAFQGLWSRNTHPNHFPEDMWNTKLGDIIGASHKFDKSFWQQGRFATAGLKLLAEDGDTSELETELKEMNDDIRTIIKARELAHPKITGTSYTVFRVDNENHLISLVSKITPSPDWIVGVANLDLCLENGSWASSYTFNLYPWDVGTDDGLTYDSSNSPSIPAQLIRPIKSNSPNTDESPFYDPDGKPVKPLAKLHLTRQKLYEKECNEAAATTEAFDSDKCQVGEWSEWSSCSVSCGTGHITRDRQLVNQKYHRLCTKDNPQLLQQTEECDTGVTCFGGVTYAENDCANTVWEPWTECSVSCGNGTKERYRSRASDDENEEEDEDNDEDEGNERCSGHKETVECFQPPCQQQPFGPIEPDNYHLITAGPSGPVVDCKTTRWSVWSPCDTSIPCKKRYKFKARSIVIHAQNGGKPCPRKLQKKKRCKCSKDQGIAETVRPDEESVDCVMGPWSHWSPCTTTCGYAVQQRTRSILIHPKGNGKPCGRRIDDKQCPLPLACTDSSFPYYR